MKILNEVAIWLAATSILIDYGNNTLTDGNLIIRSFLIVANAICLTMWDKE